MLLAVSQFSRAVTSSVQCLTQVHVQVNTIEEVDEQRQFIEALPRKVRELMLEVDASKVGLKGCETAILSPPDAASASAGRSSHPKKECCPCTASSVRC